MGLGAIEAWQSISSLAIRQLVEVEVLLGNRQVVARSITYCSRATVEYPYGGTTGFAIPPNSPR
jgi:hypothetical protein